MLPVPTIFYYQLIVMLPAPSYISMGVDPQQPVCEDFANAIRNGTLSPGKGDVSLAAVRILAAVGGV
jgi:hypothetical protein